MYYEGDEVFWTRERKPVSVIAGHVQSSRLAAWILMSQIRRIPSQVSQRDHISGAEAEIAVAVAAVAAVVVVVAAATTTTIIMMVKIHTAILK